MNVNVFPILSSRRCLCAGLFSIFLLAACHAPAAKPAVKIDTVKTNETAMETVADPVVRAETPGGEIKSPEDNLARNSRLIDSLKKLNVMLKDPKNLNMDAMNQLFPMQKESQMIGDYFMHQRKNFSKIQEKQMQAGLDSLSEELFQLTEKLKN